MLQTCTCYNVIVTHAHTHTRTHARTHTHTHTHTQAVGSVIELADKVVNGEVKVSHYLPPSILPCITVSSVARMDLPLFVLLDIMLFQTKPCECLLK